MGNPLDEKILSYNDVVLRKSDLDILSGPYYLNDRIIEFYLSYLSTLHLSESILLVPPSIAFWIMHCPDIESLNDFLQPLALHSRKLVIFPVNDNDDVSKAEGGNHWSLLVFYRDANVFVHHDSNNGMNTYHAKQLYKAVSKFMDDSDSMPVYLKCDDSPQQVNGYDCGLYVTAISRVICNWYEQNKDMGGDGSWFSTVMEQVSPDFVAKMRGEILKIVRMLMVANDNQPVVTK